MMGLEQIVTLPDSGEHLGVMEHLGQYEGEAGCMQSDKLGYFLAGIGPRTEKYWQGTD